MLVVSIVTLSFRSTRSRSVTASRRTRRAVPCAVRGRRRRPRGAASRAVPLRPERRASGTIRSWRPHSRVVGTAMRRRSASGICFVSVAISRRIVRLTCRTVARRPRVRVERGEPFGVAAAIGVEVEEREAVEPFGVACARTDAEPDRHVSKSHRHAVRADAGRAVHDEPAQEVAAPGGEARRGAAEQRMGDERRLLGTASAPARR